MTFDSAYRNGDYFDNVGDVLTASVTEGLKTTGSNCLRFRLLWCHQRETTRHFSYGFFIRILNEDKRGPLPFLIFSLLMLVSTGGKERSAPEFKHLLEKHGL